MKEVSADFERAFADGCGGCVRDCACGRTCFDVANDGWTWEPGEFERLETLAKEKPEQYAGLPYSIDTYSVSGVSYVMGCPCGGPLQQEKFIIENAEAIATYLNKRAERFKAHAETITVVPPLHAQG